MKPEFVDNRNGNTLVTVGWHAQSLRLRVASMRRLTNHAVGKASGRATRPAFTEHWQSQWHARDR
jgi:hypothetical protein